MVDGALGFEAYIRDRDFNNSINGMEAKLRNLSSTAIGETSKMDDAFREVGLAVGAYFTFQGAEQFVMKLIDVRSQFQQLDIAFTTMLQSKEKSNKLMGEMVTLAAKTPFTLTDVAGGAKQLLAYQVGADQITESLTMLGNVASGVGVPLSRLILVYGQVKAKGKLMGDDLRQFTEAGVPMIHELAKQFGVADDQIAKMIESGQVGFPAVEKVLKSLTSQGGMFFNLMEKQSFSLNGQISNLSDKFTVMLNKIGESQEGLLYSGIAGLSTMVENYEEIGKTILELIAIYGAYRTALIATAAIQTALSAVQTVQGTLAMVKAVNLMTVAMGGYAQATTVATVAQAAFNLISPVGWIAIATAAIGGAVAAYYLWGETLDATRDRLEEHEQAIKGTEKAVEDYTAKVDRLVNAANNEKLSTAERTAKLNELKALYPELLSKMTLEGLKIKENSDLIKEQTRLVGDNMTAKGLSVLQDENNARIEQINSERKNIAKLQDSFATRTKDNQNRDTALLEEYNGLMRENAKLANNIADIIKRAEERRKADKAKAEQELKDSETLTQRKARMKEEIRLNQEIANTEGVKATAVIKANAKIAEAESELAKLGERKKSTSTTKDAVKEELDAFQKALEAKKQQYQLYYKWVELYGAEIADKQFKDLLAQGLSYTDYLKREVEKLEGKKESAGEVAKKTKITSVELQKLTILKEDLTPLTNEMTAEDLIRKRLGDVESAAKYGETELAKSKRYIDEIGLLIKDIQTDKGIFATMTPEEKFVTVEALAKQKVAEEAKYAKGQEDYLAELVLSYQTLEQKKTSILATGNKEIEDLLKKGFTKEAEVRKKAMDDQAADIELQERTLNKEFEFLAIGGEDLSRSIVKQLIEIAEAEFTAIKDILPDKAQEIRDYIDNLKRNVSDRSFLNFSYIKEQKKIIADPKTDTISKLVAEVKYQEAFNVKIDQAIGYAKELVSIIAEISPELREAAQVTDSMLTALSQFASGNYIGGIISMLSGVVSYYVNAKKEEAEFQQQLLDDAATALENYNKRLMLIVSQQSDIMDGVFGTEKIEKYNLQIASLIKNMNYTISQLNARWADQIAEGIPALPNIDPNASLSDIIKQLNDIKETSIDTAEQVLLTNTQMTEAERKELEALLGTYNESLDLLEEMKKAKEEYLTGTTAESISAGLLKGFEDGFSSVDELGNYMEETFRKAVLQGLMTSILDPQIALWMEDFAAAMESEGGLSKEEMAELSASMQNINDAGNAYMAGMEALGLNFGDLASATQLSGAVRNIQEETANIIAGQLNAIRINQTSALRNMESNLIANEETARNTRWLQKMYEVMTAGAINELGGGGLKIGG